jgi:hypothetical protein
VLGQFDSESIVVMARRAVDRLAEAERERNDALSHEGEKDAQIEQLLEYLKYDSVTASHPDWVGRAQEAEARLAEAEKLLSATTEVLDEYEAGTDEFAQKWEILGFLDRAADRMLDLTPIGPGRTVDDALTDSADAGAKP